MGCSSAEFNSVRLGGEKFNGISQYVPPQPAIGRYNYGVFLAYVHFFKRYCIAFCTVEI